MKAITEQFGGLQEGMLNLSLALGTAWVSVGFVLQRLLG